jgi:hypothetical protein
MKTVRSLVLGVAVALFAACQGAQGPQGPTGPEGPQGSAGPAGAKGDPGDPLAAVIPVQQWDGDMHQMTTTNMSVAQALCLARHGIWDSGTSTCGTPLTYGTANVPRTDSDGAAIASCPSGYTPADCATAYFLLNFWRMNPNREALPNGHAWCAGTIDGLTLNSGAGLVGVPGYWYSGGQIAAPNVCGAGNALVIDLITSAEYQAWQSRPSYPRPHIYCVAATQTNPWMCISTRLP